MVEFHTLGLIRSIRLLDFSTLYLLPDDIPFVIGCVARKVDLGHCAKVHHEVVVCMRS